MSLDSVTSEFEVGEIFITKQLVWNTSQYIKQSEKSFNSFAFGNSLMINNICIIYTPSNIYSPKYLYYLVIPHLQHNQWWRNSGRLNPPSPIPFQFQTVYFIEAFIETLYPNRSCPFHALFNFINELVFFHITLKWKLLHKSLSRNGRYVSWDC